MLALNSVRCILSFCANSLYLFGCCSCQAGLLAMKDFHLPLNQTQRVRFETALHKLQVLTPTMVLAAAVTIADTIPINHEDSVLRLPTLSRPIYLSLFLHFVWTNGSACRGHWTLDQKGKLVSTLCGVVEWVDKLVHDSMCGRSRQGTLTYYLCPLVSLLCCSDNIGIGCGDLPL